MSENFLIVPVLLPLLGALGVRFIKLGNKRARQAAVILTTFCEAAAIWAAILFCGGGRYEIFEISDGAHIVLAFDGLGKFFAGIIGLLWPLTAIYSFGYMDDNVYSTRFYEFFLLSLGITIGIAEAGNMITMYCFYEFLTLATLPLIMYYMTKTSVRAGLKYLVFAIGGAAFAFVGMAYLMAEGFSLDFVLGGTVSTTEKVNTYLVIYLMMFFGFGVKAGIFPLHYWLPSASVAPTPVTSILHAVAVVKAGVFAVIRLTWYGFDIDFIRETWAHNIALIFVIFTILYGSVMAIKRRHWKLKMVYSTVSNLSYILFSALLLTPLGLAAALLHMAFHAVMKILAFFCVGAVQEESGAIYISELNGMGRKMPITFACYTIAAAAMTGIPLFCGFVSKYNILLAAANYADGSAWLGAGAILVSALMTAVYMFPAVQRAFFPAGGVSSSFADKAKEANRFMLVPIVILGAVCVFFGIYAWPIVKVAGGIAAGTI